MCSESRARLYKDVISTNQTDETMCNMTAAAAHSAEWMEKDESRTSRHMRSRAASVSWLCSYWKRSVRHAFGYYIYYIVLFFCFYSGKRKKNSPHMALCVYFLRESSFFFVFSLSTCFSAFCSSCLRNGDFWDVSRILEKRAWASSCRCCHCAPWHIHPEVFFLFPTMEEKKSSDWMKNDKIPCSESWFPALFQL